MNTLNAPNPNSMLTTSIAENITSNIIGTVDDSGTSALPLIQYQGVGGSHANQLDLAPKAHSTLVGELIDGLVNDMGPDSMLGLQDVQMSNTPLLGGKGPGQLGKGSQSSDVLLGNMGDGPITGQSTADSLLGNITGGADMTIGIAPPANGKTTLEIVPPPQGGISIGIMPPVEGDITIGIDPSVEPPQPPQSGSNGDGSIGDGSIGDGSNGDGSNGDGSIGDGSIGDGATHSETGSGYITRAKELWDNRTATFGTRDLANVLQQEGASAKQIAQAFNFGLSWNIETIADALDDGTTFGYSSIAEGLWHSGHTFGSRKLADVLWDEGATETDIGQAMKSLNFTVETIADALDDGITQHDGTGLSYAGVATGLWHSGHTFDTRKLADLLWDEGASQADIGQAMKALNFGLSTIADAMDDGVTKSDGTTLNYTSVATALWESGHAISTRTLADLLWDEGAAQDEIGRAMKNLGFGLTTIADAMDDGVTKSDGTTLNYTDTAIALWNSGHAFGTRQLADLLWDEGATQAQIGKAMKHLEFDLTTIADAIDDGVTKSDGTTLNYTDTAIALWNSGHSINSRTLADLLWDEGATQEQIGQAMKHLGFGLSTIADAIDDGVTKSDGTTLNYMDTAIALWNSGHSINSRTLADLLWDEGASQAQIGKVMKNLGFGLKTIADAIDDGVTKSDGATLNYIDTAIALWHSGHNPSARQIADLLWDEGASQTQIGQAMKHLGFSLRTIADALDDGVTKSNGAGLNYTSVAVGLRNSGYRPSARQIADLLWDEGASQSDIGQALKYLGFGLRTIADAIDDGVTKSDGTTLNYIDTAIALWHSGLPTNSREVADILWDEGAYQETIGKALRYLGISKEGIADAMADGVTNGTSRMNATDVALAVWHSGHGMSSYRLGKILRDEGFGRNSAASAVSSVTGVSYAKAWLDVAVSDVKDWLNDTAKQARAIGNTIEQFYDDNKAIGGILNAPTVIGVETTKSIIQSIEAVNTDTIVDLLKRIPVVGTAVGAVEGLVNALEGDDKGALKSAIDSALAFYGASNVITPKMVDFAIDILWELKDEDYQGAISETLTNLGVQQTVSEVFVAVAWAMEQGSWETAIDAALSQVGLPNATELVDMAWNILEQNYQEALKAGLDLVGVNTLGIDQAKADAIIQVAVAIREGDTNTVADYLIALAGTDAHPLNQSEWVKALRDGNPADDRQALQLGLSELGFAHATQWVDTIWAVKDGQYLDAVSNILSLGQFQSAEDWLSIIGDLKQEKYLDALATAFDLADFQDGQSLAEAAIAVRDGDLIEAVYESFDLIEGGSDLKDAFKALVDFDLPDFIASMVNAAPILLKLL
ncbi:MAG: hypothetical protein AAGD25_12705 [Cyanobacteria bacterium P01_F01_bin.150]